MDKIHMAGPWMTDLEIEYVKDAITNCSYENPYKYCEQFENEFAAYHGRKFALMTPNCTSAIHLLLMGLGIGEGDEVILPECTWIASAAPTSYVRATPVFCDIDEDDWCISPDSIEKNITEKTKAVIAVDLFGNMPKFKEIEKICKDKGITLIEDSAEALGSLYCGKKAGSFGIASVFSFHRTKTVAIGEGGMLLLDSEELFNTCTKLRDHGRGPETPTYYNDIIGYKYMPFNIQAAVGLAQFHRLKELTDRKRSILHAYKMGLSEIADRVSLNYESEDVYNCAWITGLVFAKETGITQETAISKLSENGIPARPFFYPLSSIPAYKDICHTEEMKRRNPISYDVSSRGINLPSAPNLKKEQIDSICLNIKNLLD